MVKRSVGEWMLTALMAVALVGCGHSHDDDKKAATPQPQPQAATPVSQGSKERVFTGTIPCHENNCTAINVKVTLHSTKDGQPSNFTNSENFMNGSNTTRIVTVLGRWSIITGSAQDQNALVYQVGSLDNHPLFFELVNDHTLRMLGSNMEPYDPKHNYDLTLQTQK